MVKDELIGRPVLTNYGKPTFYKIKDVEYKEMDEVRISEKYPKLSDYYRERYNITILNKKQPLLVVEQKNGRKNKMLDEEQETCYLVPELCLMTGIPPDFDEMRRKKISEQTILPPQEKYREIQQFMSKLKESGELDDLEEMGIHISTRMAEISAKQLNNPSLSLGRNRSIARGKEANFPLYG